MSAALHLAGPDDLPKLTALVAAFHAEMEITQDDGTRARGLTPLLEGSPYGAAYLVGPKSAPIGYIIVTFGWSVEFGGMEGFVDEMYVRPGVRGRGVASEVMLSLPRALAETGLKALHLEVDREDAAAQRLYEKTGFVRRDRYMLMTRIF
jgi:ribosomal protein S18 acetylase RimI-like enzyme